MAKQKFLHVKLSGGATAQCLGLMNGIYASNKLKIPFKVSYFPYSTGTYWPFAIADLLAKEEILNTNTPTKGLDSSKEFEIGKIIQDHPLISKKISYEKILSILRYLNLEPGWQFFRRELAILASPKRIIDISHYYHSISGGFAAINELDVNESLHARFIKSGMPSPFGKTLAEKKLTVIHYRLGDKKATGHYPSEFNSDLIIHPDSYVDVLSKISDTNLKNVYVVSDEPELAQELLSSVKIKARIYSYSGNIWEDIYFMSQADIFIGSKSQVSQLANIFVEHNGGKSFMLNLKAPKDYDNFKNTRYLMPRFIESTNTFYNLNFKLEENSHSAYNYKK